MTLSNSDDAARRIVSLDPIVGAKPRVLILGSMPGAQSLAAGRYYIHPRNAFWSIMRALDLCEEGDYDMRVESLKSKGVALWDSLRSCERLEGSLDSQINASTEVANDFTGFFATHPTIRAVFFNGAKAEHAFARHVKPTLDEALNQTLGFGRLPSTSPAHAVALSKKIEAWRVLLNDL